MFSGTLEREGETRELQEEEGRGSSASSLCHCRDPKVEEQAAKPREEERESREIQSC